MQSLLKTQDFAVRFASGVTRQTVSIGRPLKAVRGINLKGYAASGVDTAPMMHFIKIEELGAHQMTSESLPGYAIPVAALSYHPVTNLGNCIVDYDKPRMVSNQAVPLLRQLTIHVATSTGVAPIYTELLLFFEIIYEDDRVELLPEEMTRPQFTLHDYNKRQPTEADDRVQRYMAQREVFSRLRGK